MDHIFKLIYPDGEGAGDATAALAHAMRVYTGDGVPEDRETAHAILDGLHKRGRSYAAVCLGFMRDYGIGMELDPAGADECYAQAYAAFSEEADQGDPLARNNLGYLLASGLGVKANAKAAAKQFKAAADLGCQAAAYNLAVCYLNGSGVTPDDKKAVALLEAAQERGDPYACYALADLYQQGRGVKPNFKRALHLLQEAARLGNTEAYGALGYAYGVGMGGERDLKLAMRWFKKAAEAGDNYARANLAVFWCRSDDVTLHDRGWAVLQEASELGDLNARYQMAQLHFRGTQYRATDYVLAFDLAMELSELGHAGGLNLLGAMYEQGAGVPSDLPRAVEWYRKSAIGGSSAAQGALGRLYAQGGGVAKDFAMAYFWLSQASPAASTRAGKYFKQVCDNISESELSKARKLLKTLPKPKRNSFAMRLY